MSFSEVLSCFALVIIVIAIAVIVIEPPVVLLDFRLLLWYSLHTVFSFVGPVSLILHFNSLGFGLNILFG